MIASPPLTLLIDGPGDGAWNMALDEVLLDEAVESGRSSWRFYQWQHPTLSLGYFQQAAERTAHRPSRRCPVVRRPTGGGAILHHVELTYSLILPAGHPLSRQRQKLYAAVHESLIATLAENWKIPAVLHRGGPREAAGAAPFLCFRRRAPGDVLVDAAKIAGSAQRRRRGAVLQHGSVLLDTSPNAPELPGLRELTGREIHPDALREAWLEVLRRTLAERWEPADLADAARLQAGELTFGKYTAGWWTQRR
ncbi:MAG: lipoate--protein ligase family protein [Pirellulales bacterium]